MPARSDEPVIIEVAVNGGTTKERNPHAPIGVEEIVEVALDCVGAGAQIVHQHDDLGRGGMLGGASPEEMAKCGLSVYEAVLAVYPDTILYPTANWDGGIEHRWAHHEILAERGVLRAAYVDPGSVNLGGFDENGLPGGEHTFVYDNSFSDVRWMFEQCERLKVGPSMAIFEPGFLRVALAYESADRMPAGAFAKLYFGGFLTFGLPPSRASLDAYLAMLDGSRLPWAVAVVGGDVMESGVARMALEAGGHLRVGLEDYAGARQPSNRELLDEALALCAEVGRPVATPAQTAEILGLPRPAAA